VVTKTAGGVSGRVVSGIGPHHFCTMMVSGGGATSMPGWRHVSQVW